MGLSGISIAQLTILLVIVLAVFGTKKLRTLGEDLGKAVKSFRQAMETTESSDSETQPQPTNTDKKTTE